MKSCDNCIHKETERKDSKYTKHSIYCNKRKCVIPDPEEAKWCRYWNKSNND